MPSTDTSGSETSSPIFSAKIISLHPKLLGDDAGELAEVGL